MSVRYRFVFDSVDQARMDKSALDVADAPASETPDATSPYPQSLVIKFSLGSDPQIPPVLRLLMPGQLTFIAEPGSKPPPSPDSVTPANYGDWPTRGRLMLVVHKREDLEALARDTGLEVVPTTFWYEPVVLTKEFLFEGLLLLDKADVCERPRARWSWEVDQQNWLPHAIASFLAGKYSPSIQQRATEAEDDAALAALPVAPVTGGAGRLVVTAAQRVTYFDGTTAELPTMSSAIDDNHPAHPTFGAVPVRHVFRRLLGSLRGAAQGDVVAAAALPPTGQAGIVDYYPLRFTRIFKPEPEGSVYFPWQVVNIEHLLFTQPFRLRLPGHGVVFLPLTSEQRDTSISVSILNPVDPNDPRHKPPEREMLWLSAALDSNTPPAERDLPAWRRAASATPLVLTCKNSNQTHIILRRRFRYEVLRETRHRVDASSPCTYISMRRVVRAFVDHRISGGRLNFRCDCESSPSHVRKLLADAFGGTEASSKYLVDSLADDQPDVRTLKKHGDVTKQSGQLLSILKALFPDPVGPKGGEKYLGEIAYYIWQTETDQFAADPTGQYYKHEWLGGGGAGAALALGLASSYAFEQPEDLKLRDDYADEVVNRMLRTRDKAPPMLELGAALQCWNRRDIFEAIRERKTGSASGHSPIYVSYRTATEADKERRMTIIDQHGEIYYPIIITEPTGEVHDKVDIDKNDKQRIQVGDPNDSNPKMYPDVWLAANWNE